MRTTDTIAAISTALSPGGIGIVRLSGEDSVRIADRVYRGVRRLSDCATHTINYGYICDGEERVDQVLVMLMRAPHTYTGEDVVEIDCHGGMIVLERVLSLVLAAGAIPAEPGEFTKRAFLNGKMDLSQAEAVLDIIEAGNELALRNGEDQLGGRLSGRIKDMRSRLLGEIAYIEAALDDPEHYDLTGYGEDTLKGILTGIAAEISALLRDADAGIFMKSGINTVILGRPNAGKSSIYNLLAGTERAIVTEIAGTTRDTLTEHIMMRGISLNITDTAGIRESDDRVEKIGVERARQAAYSADLVLFIIDGSEALSEEDTEMIRQLKDKKIIVLLNKSDIDTAVQPSDIEQIADVPVIIFSAREGTGRTELEDRIKEMFYTGELENTDRIYITSLRHKDALKRAGESVDNVLRSIEDGMPEDFLSIDLTDAYGALGEITGETVGDEIIDEIFSRFCMGK